MSDEDPVNGGGGRHLGSRMGLVQELVKFASAPAPMLPQLENLANQGRLGSVRALVGSMGAISEALGTQAGISIEPLVAGLAADTIAPTELGEGGGGVLGVEHETLALVHG
jgi:hypothetical protein